MLHSLRYALRQLRNSPGFAATAGLLGAVLTGYALRAEFYHARAASLPVLAASLALLVLPSLVAIALPARRAAHLDPVQTLRSE